MTATIRATGLILATLSLPSFAATSIYSQDWDQTNNGSISVEDVAPAGWDESVNGPYPSWGVVGQVYDNFKLSSSIYASSASLSNISWVGSYGNPDPTLGLGQFGPVNPQFLVQIFQSGGSNTLLFETTTQANEQNLGNGNYGYSFNLANSINLLLDTDYIIGVQAKYSMTEDLFGSSWYWAHSNQGDNFSEVFNNTVQSPDDHTFPQLDFAYTLSGDVQLVPPTTVPEPSTLMLIGLAAAGMRRFRNA